MARRPPAYQANPDNPNPPSDREPWDILPTEGPDQYAAFLRYRDTPPLQRSFEDLARALGDEMGFHKSPNRDTLRTWARRANWLGRCAAWDQFLRQERDAKIIAMASEEGERIAEVARRQLKAAERFITALEARLNAGALDRADLATLIKSWPSATKAYEAAFKSLRVLSREPTEQLRIEGHVEVRPVSPFDWDRVSSDQLRRAREALKKLMSEGPVEPMVDGETIPLVQQRPANDPSSEADESLAEGLRLLPPPSPSHE
jgi:hypothetical protein